MSFLHLTLSRLQGKRRSAMEKAMSVVGGITSQEAKRLQVFMRKVGKASSEMSLLNPAEELGVMMRHSFVQRAYKSLASSLWILGTGYDWCLYFQANEVIEGANMGGKLLWRILA